MRNERILLILTSSVLAATVGSMRLVKLVLLPCLLFLDKQPTSETSPAAILAILSFSKHCDSGIPNTRPPLDDSEIKYERIKYVVDLVDRRTILPALCKKPTVLVLEEINDARDGRNKSNYQ